MTRPKGRAIGSLAVLVAAWASARIMIWQPDAIIILPSIEQKMVIAAQTMPHPVWPSSEQLMPTHFKPARGKIPAAIWSIDPQRLSPADGIATSQQGPPTHTAALTPTNSLSYMVQSTPLAPPKTSVLTAPSLTLTPASMPLLGKNNNQVMRFYAYSFWRVGTGHDNDLAALEFGGSQSGFIAEIPIRLKKHSGANTAILLRSLAVPNDPMQNELGIGMRWRPLQNAAITFSVEQRIRADGQLRRVAYLAASPPPIKLGPKLQIHSYAQIGVSNGTTDAAFADMQARIDMPIFHRAKAQIILAPIAAMNVYNDSYRIEIGPSLSSDIAIKGATLRLSADWRVQVMGNISRRSGPTVTLSSSF